MGLSSFLIYLWQRAQWQVERRFEPTLSRERAAEAMARWERAVQQASLGV